MQTPARPACLMEQVTNIVIKRWGGRAGQLVLDQVLDQALALALAQAGEVGKSTHA